jgi:L-arabinose isomerase
MTQVRFDLPPSQFMDRWFALGPTHHCAMSVGHNAATFRKLANIMGWPCDTVIDKSFTK